MRPVPTSPGKKILTPLHKAKKQTQCQLTKNCENVYNHTPQYAATK
jgi:hypothetical protein